MLKKLKKPEDDPTPQNDFEMPLTVQELYDKVATNAETSTYETYESFYEELKTTLLFFIDYLDGRDLLSLMASASLLLIEKLVEDNEIFQYIKPASLKG